MTQQEIIEKLQSGWNLTNRGRGWWLNAPSVPYKRTEQYKIDDALVDSMTKAGILSVDIPYTTAWATLVKPL
jgi:hypothetical protein